MTASVWIVPAFADSVRSWRALLTSPFAERRSVTVLDLPGVGIPRTDTAPTDIDAMAAHIATSIVAGATDRMSVVIGHSLGSTIAVRARGRPPGVVAGPSLHRREPHRRR